MWSAKETGPYAIGSPEARGNIDEIANLLVSDFSLGQTWDILSISAVCGNIGNEGGLNPWRWEADIVPTYTDFEEWMADPSVRNSHGYGLFGYTPADRYINNTNATTYANDGYSPHFRDQTGTPEDGNAQMLFMLTEFRSSWNVRSPSYIINYYGQVLAQNGFDNNEINAIAYMTADEFITAAYYEQYRLDVLTMAFMTHFEGPSSNPNTIHIQERVASAYSVYDYLEDNPPVPLLITNANTWKFYLY